MADFTRMHRSLRKRVHDSGRVHLLSPSKWLSNMAFSSGMLAKPPTVMPNPVDTRTFSPTADKGMLRRKLGLPHDRLILIALAGDLNDPRKGLRETLDASAALSDLRPHLVLIGKEPEGGLMLGSDVSVTITGFVSDAAKLSEWYAASDALIFCSAMDNQPLTILEALSCGIPTFGFAVGGAGELITQSETGFMVPHGDIPQLTARLRQAFLSGSLAEMGREARRYVLAHHDLEVVTSRHIQLYRLLLSAERPPQ
jgi:glycosyltransferase involved in cell wall biosynthesis